MLNHERLNWGYYQIGVNLGLQNTIHAPAKIINIRPDISFVCRIYVTVSKDAR